MASRYLLIGVASATTLGFGSYDLYSPMLQRGAAANDLPMLRMCAATPPDDASGSADSHH